MGLLDDIRILIEQGADWLAGVFDGPMKDWANSDIGLTVLRAVASSLTGGLAQFVGPQLASAAFALPGLVRGESFDEAWWKEFSWRVQTTAEILGPSISEDIGRELKTAGTELRRLAGEHFPDIPVEDALRQIAIGVGELAQRLGIREDVAAAAISLAKRLPLPSWERYDVRSGKRAPLVSVRLALALVHAGSGALRGVVSGHGYGGSVLRWMRSIP